MVIAYAVCSVYFARITFLLPIAAALHRYAADPPMTSGRRFAIVTGVITIVGLCWFVYRLIHPPDSFYRSELERATGIALPESAHLVAGCSSFYDTAAVYEVERESWPALLQAFRNAGRPGSMFPDVECEPSVRPSLGNAPDSLVIVMAGFDQLIWGVNEEQHRIYWQVTVD